MKRAAVALAALLITSIILTGVLAAFAEPRQPAFSADWQYTADFGEGGSETIRFIPRVTGPYDLFVYGGAALEEAVIYTSDAEVARGSGTLCVLSAELTAGSTYMLEISGAGEVRMELMRHGAGRSIFVPNTLEGSRVGSIVLPGSAAWYTFETDADRASVYVFPEDGGMQLSAELFTADGMPVAVSGETDGGGCRLYFEPEEGVDYALRICSPSGGRGNFRVSMTESSGEAPSEISIMSGELTIREGDMRALAARVLPQGADDRVAWASSDSEVVTVDENGVITGVKAGIARVTAYGYGGLQAVAEITVERVEPEYIAYRGSFLTVRVGDELTPSIQIYPAAAADDEEIVYQSSDPTVVQISETGGITAVAEGTAVISASYGDIRSEMTVNVEAAPVRYRVLMISEQNYAQDVNTVRVGAVNTVYNLESLFSTASYNGDPCSITVEVDITAEEAYAAIDAAFADAREEDVSILYITCHGYYENGMTVLQFVDGSEMTAFDLERALRRVPGTVVVIADCCDSGGLIGSYEDMARMSGGIVTAFAGGGSVFSSSKYKVLASAAPGQDSYRLGYASGENDAVTVFAWALCDAMGWDVDDQHRGALNADSNYDGRITLWEAYQYADRRVMWYLSRAGSDLVQDVQVYPEGDMFVLFERE